MGLTEILRRVQEELVRKDEVRQEIHKAMQKAVRLSKQAIFMVHKEKFEEAESTLMEAKALQDTLNVLTKDYPELSYMGSVDAAFQEYAEARIFLDLVKNGRFVDFEEINVPVTPYVLGLADVIGELRRRALDLLRKGEAEKAEEYLELMETIYGELISLDEIHFLISGLRNKCDIARRVIEATRGDVTNEVRRSLLENSMKELRETLEGKRRDEVS